MLHWQRHWGVNANRILAHIFLLAMMNGLKKNYQSILPTEQVPLTGHVASRNVETNPKVRHDLRAVILAFSLGVVVVVCMAAVFLVLPFNSTNTANDGIVVPHEQSILPSVEIWDEWKDEMVHAAAQAFQNNDDSSFLLLQEWWGESATETVQNWWNNVAESTSHLVQEDSHQTSEWIKKKGQEAGEWVGSTAQRTQHFAQEGENATGEFLEGAANKTEHVAKKTGTKAGQWIGEEAEKTKELGNTTEHWVGKESNQAGAWVKQEAKRAGEETENAARWVGDEARSAGEWIVKEGNATEHVVAHDTEQGAEWMEEETKRGAHGTAEWFKKESNATEHWITKEAQESARWFEKEANETGNWVKKEGNTTGQWFKKQSNRTVHWWEADTEAIRIWWHNVTRRNKVQDETLVYFNTTAAFALLVSGYGWYDSSRDFFAYQQGFDAQENQAYCSVASAAAVINSFRGRLDLPVDPLYKPYPYATQDSLFNECTDEKVTVHNATFDGLLVAPGGLNLDQTKSLIECNLPSTGWDVEATHVDPAQVTLDDMRKDLVMALMSPASRVVVNFHRTEATQEGGGHFSPLGGYSHDRDAFLLMDVAKYKYPFVWIPASVLYRSLMTVDACGSWKSPKAQMISLDSDELKQPKSARDLAKAMPKLGCKAAFRGYLIVKQL